MNRGQNSKVKILIILIFELSLLCRLINPTKSYHEMVPTGKGEKFLISSRQGFPLKNFGGETNEFLMCWWGKGFAAIFSGVGMGLKSLISPL